MVELKRYDGHGDPPPLHWKPSHPATVYRFKATVTCARGHTMTLRGHSVAGNGEVRPSLVCPLCTFHEWVTLRDWP